MNNLIKSNKLNLKSKRSQRGNAAGLAFVVGLLVYVIVIIAWVDMGKDLTQKWQQWSESANKDIVELASGTSKYSIQEQEEMLFRIRNVTSRRVAGVSQEDCFAIRANAACFEIYDKLETALVNSIARAGNQQSSQNQNQPQATTNQVDQAALIKKVLDERKARESTPIPLSEAELESMPTEELEALYARSLKSSQSAN